MTEPVLYDHYYKGRAPEVSQWLQSSIGQYMRGHEHCYIGRTMDPWRRFGEHCSRYKNDKLLHMTLIYKTRSFASMVKVESEAIEYINGSTTYTGRVLNEVSGRALAEDFYLYGLVDDGTKKKSLSDTIEETKYLTEGKRASDRLGEIDTQVKRAFRGAAYTYVGFTEDPQTRFKQHQKVYVKSEAWSKMVIFFKSKNLHDTLGCEGKLISMAKKHGKADCCLNVQQPKPWSANHDFFVYILVFD